MTTLTAQTTGLTLELERIERLAWADLYAAATGELARNTGARSLTVGPAVAGIASQVDVLAFNRVLGLGLGDTAEPAQIDQLIHTYTEANVGRFFVQLAPAAEPSALPDWLITRGFRHYNNWVKLARNVSALPLRRSEVRVEQIRADQALQFAELFVAAFDWPDVVTPWIAAIVGRPGWRFYLAYIDDQTLATGGMYIDGETAWLDFASTHPGFRGRGAQTALIERRIRDAAAAGVRTLVTETAEDGTEKPSISKRNLIRCGFAEVYHRPNYLFEAGSGADSHRRFQTSRGREHT